MSHQLIDYRMPVPYQYSALRQFDNDPDDDVVDPEHSLNMMVEDTSSDEEEIIGNGNSTSSKTIGAIDIDPPDANAVIQFTNFSLLDFCILLPILKPFQPATLPVSITEATSTKTLKSGRRRSGSTNLLGDDNSDKSSSNLTFFLKITAPLLHPVFLFRKNL